MIHTVNGRSQLTINPNKIRREDLTPREADIRRREAQRKIEDRRMEKELFGADPW